MKTIRLYLLLGAVLASTTADAAGKRADTVLGVSVIPYYVGYCSWPEDVKLDEEKAKATYIDVAMSIKLTDKEGRKASDQLDEWTVTNGHRKFCDIAINLMRQYPAYSVLIKGAQQ